MSIRMKSITTGTLPSSHKNHSFSWTAIKTFKIIYPDVIASLDNFSSDERSYPIEYCSYEDVDYYETIVNITAPPGKKFIEVPLTETFSFKKLKYTLKYTLKAPDRLMVTRQFSNDRQNIPAKDYIDFKDLFEKIVKAEQKFIAYKWSR